MARVEFDNAEDILLITPEEGYSYTAEDGTVYTKTEDGYTYMDAAGQEQTAHLGCSLSGSSPMTPSLIS